MLTNGKFFLPGDFTSVFSFALRDGGIADSNFILEETQESRPPSDADPGETEILQLQSQQETDIVCFFFYMLKIAAAKQMSISKSFFIIIL